MNVSRRRYMGEKGGSIPYQRIEYLESSGTQYINTLFVPTQDNFRVVFSCEKSAAGDNIVYGINISQNGSGFNFNWYTQTVYVRNIGVLLTNVCLYGKHNFEVNENYYIQDGVQNQCQRNGTFVGNLNPLILLAYYNYNYKFKGKIYYFKAYYGDTLVLDLIPVRVEQVGYMYDKVSGQLFGNSGTGNFTLGPDVN